MDDKYAREVALEILAEKGLFDPGHHRLIEGIAATAVLSKNGTILDPAGALFTLPVPLLFSHNWLRPIGLVTRAHVSPAGLRFTAQIANFKLAWLPKIWDGLKAGSIPAVSCWCQWAFSCVYPLEMGRIVGPRRRRQSTVRYYSGQRGLPG